MDGKFTLGVGGAVVRDRRLLLVHHTYGAKKWQIPGGYVKLHECAHESVVREVYEETGIRAKVDGLLGVRHRVKEGDNSTYLIFKMTPLHPYDYPTPDGREVDAANYFTLKEIEAFTSEEIPALNQCVARRVLSGAPMLMLDQGDADGLNRPYNLYLHT
ncbi:MAG: NUDIX domain-containing protein [Candidatus Poribacteria bacterium]|nr:NUDIX domain-containing protein [Candidatus Poribacteria bacterium]